MNVGFLEEPGLQAEWRVDTQHIVYTQQVTAHLSEYLIPVLEALEGDKDWPGAPHLWPRVHSAGLHNSVLRDNREYLLRNSCSCGLSGFSPCRVVGGLGITRQPLNLLRFGNDLAHPTYLETIREHSDVS